MATGFRDYYMGVIPVKEVFGEDQTPVFEYGSESVAALESVEVIDYTVPAGYVLYIKEICICSSFTSISELYINIDDVLNRRVIFDQRFHCCFPEGAEIVLAAEQNITFNGSNLSDWASGYYVYFAGFLVQQTA